MDAQPSPPFDIIDMLKFRECILISKEIRVHSRDFNMTIMVDWRAVLTQLYTHSMYTLWIRHNQSSM